MNEEKTSNVERRRQYRQLKLKQCQKMELVRKNISRLNPLKYYATFKVRKFESLFYTINTCLQKLPLALDCGQGNIFSKYIIYIFFNFGRDFYGSFPMLFPKVPSFCRKNNFELIFAAFYFYNY